MLTRSTIFKFIATIVGSVILSYLISFISERVNILEKFTIAITDVDFSDLYYQYRPKPEADKNIVIVNIGNLNRSELAVLLQVVSSNNPKVIGGAIFFDQEKDSLNIVGTSLLSEEVKSIDNLILASSFREEDNSIAGQSPLIQEIRKGRIGQSEYCYRRS